MLSDYPQHSRKVKTSRLYKQTYWLERFDDGMTFALMDMELKLVELASYPLQKMTWMCPVKVTEEANI